MPLPRDVVYLTDGDIEKIATRTVALLKEAMDAPDYEAPTVTTDGDIEKIATRTVALLKEAMDAPDYEAPTVTPVEVPTADDGGVAPNPDAGTPGEAGAPTAV